MRVIVMFIFRLPPALISNALSQRKVATYFEVMCTPPLNPLSKVPLPRPPAKICAFTTYSGQSVRGQLEKRLYKYLDREKLVHFAL